MEMGHFQVLGWSTITFVMVTTPPNKLIATITDRMPAVLAPGDIGVWLGEAPATPGQVKATLKPFEGDWSMAPQEPPPQRQPEAARADDSHPGPFDAPMAKQRPGPAPSPNLTRTLSRVGETRQAAQAGKVPFAD